MGVLSTLGVTGLLAGLATPLGAEPPHPARLALGDHVVMTHDWDYSTNRWFAAGPEINTACFRVMAIQDLATTLELVSGRYHTWWDKTEQKPGYQDTWDGTTPFYLEKRPDAAPRELAQGQFTTVDGCPAP